MSAKNKLTKNPSQQPVVVVPPAKPEEFLPKNPLAIAWARAIHEGRTTTLTLMKACADFPAFREAVIEAVQSAYMVDSADRKRLADSVKKALRDNVEKVEKAVVAAITTAQKASSEPLTKEQQEGIKLAVRAAENAVVWLPYGETISMGLGKIEAPKIEIKPVQARSTSKPKELPAPATDHEKELENELVTANLARARQAEELTKRDKAIKETGVKLTTALSENQALKAKVVEQASIIAELEKKLQALQPAPEVHIPNPGKRSNGANA